VAWEFSSSVGTISLCGLRVEYALEGISNFMAWKDRMEVMMDTNGVLSTHTLIL